MVPRLFNGEPLLPTGSGSVYTTPGNPNTGQWPRSVLGPRRMAPETFGPSRPVRDGVADGPLTRVRRPAFPSHAGKSAPGGSAGPRLRGFHGRRPTARAGPFGGGGKALSWRGGSRTAQKNTVGTAPGSAPQGRRQGASQLASSSPREATKSASHRARFDQGASGSASLASHSSLSAHEEQRGFLAVHT